MDREVSERRQNRGVTSPSKGLLPQLVEVLYALADSQELLTNRIRTAHLELLGVHPTHGAGSSRVLPPNPGAPDALPLAATAQIPAQCDGELFNPRSGLSTGPSGVPTDSNSNFGPEGDGIISNDSEMITPPDKPTETATFVQERDPVQAAPPQADRPQETQREEKSIEAGVRSYNFFDELDARLADLADTENEQETGS